MQISNTPAGGNPSGPQKNGPSTSATPTTSVGQASSATAAPPSGETLAVYFTGKPKPTGSLLETLPVQERVQVAKMGEDYKKFLSDAVCASWTVKAIVEAAQREGFKPFPADPSQAKPGDKVYFENDGTAIALAVIGKANPVKSGFNMIGAHVDSPQLELKPNTLVEQSGIAQLKIKTRGGGTWFTWFNRPLGIAGRVYDVERDEQGNIVRDPETRLPKETVRYVRVESPAVVIPIEAIHFNRQLNKGREILPEDDLNPLVGIDRLDEDDVQESVSASVVSAMNRHGIDLTRAHRAELYLFPSTPPSDAGTGGSLIVGQGHDDRSMCFAAMEALFETARKYPVPDKTGVAYFFANEETGSMDRGSATSRWTETVSGKLLRAGKTEPPLGDWTLAREEALSKSFILSADVAHGWMPSQGKYHDKDNAVYLGQGPVLKADSSGRYATTPKGMALAEDIFSRAGIRPQIMSTNQNVPCGTTIGPMIAANTNALTVDIGIPVLSMHAANEVAAKVDVYLAQKAFAAFYGND
jgi:aspartyl aminopeptidase